MFSEEGSGTLCSRRSESGVSCSRKGKGISVLYSRRKGISPSCHHMRGSSVSCPHMRGSSVSCSRKRGSCDSCSRGGLYQRWNGGLGRDEAGKRYSIEGDTRPAKAASVKLWQLVIPSSLRNWRTAKVPKPRDKYRTTTLSISPNPPLTPASTDHQALAHVVGPVDAVVELAVLAKAYEEGVNRHLPGRTERGRYTYSQYPNEIIHLCCPRRFFSFHI